MSNVIIAIFVGMDDSSMTGLNRIVGALGAPIDAFQAIFTRAKDAAAV
jgi:hypothetical protein